MGGVDEIPVPRSVPEAAQGLEAGWAAGGLFAEWALGRFALLSETNLCTPQSPAGFCVEFTSSRFHYRAE